MPLSQSSNSTTQADATSTLKVDHNLGVPAHPTYLQALALEVQNNLLHQHYWTSLRIHTSSPLSRKPLPRPLVSGLPPHRIYVHPDEQIEELKQGLKEETVGVEREWVLPTRLKEKWSLSRFGDVFDAICEEPEGSDPHGTQGEEQSMPKQNRVKVKHGKRRGGKRLLLATVGDDSTVVYYIVHDGIVKPRQN